VKTALTVVVTTLMAVSMASGSVRAYAIDPVRADWSGKADPNPLTGGVSQQVVACWDSLDRIELFAGAKGSGGEYRVGVVLDGDEVMHSFGGNPGETRDTSHFP
jgi:hypothetical protein